MTLNEYQELAGATADYPDMGGNLLYPAIGCGEEAGEILGKVKKLWRNLGITSGSLLSQDQKDAIEKEIGDNLWYLQQMCTELGITLEHAAQTNIDKLYDRKARGVIKSEGDNR
jgi:NTP pyrophosphatase (non-canonical NTP hydrolase)